MTSTEKVILYRFLVVYENNTFAISGTSRGYWLPLHSSLASQERSNRFFGTEQPRKFWCKASKTPLKLFCYEYGEVVMNKRPKGHTCSSLSIHFSLLVAMFLSIYPFGCRSNQWSSAFWIKCIHSVEDYTSNNSIKRLSIYLQWVRNEGLLSFFSPIQVGHLSPPHQHHLPGDALAVLPRH